MCVCTYVFMYVTVHVYMVAMDMMFLHMYACKYQCMQRCKLPSYIARRGYALSDGMMYLHSVAHL